MKRCNRRWSQAAVLAFLLTIGAATIPLQLGASADESCGDYGTAVNFVQSPQDAAKQALQEEKLVLVLHVSGHFETPEYT